MQSAVMLAIATLLLQHSTAAPLNDFIYVAGFGGGSAVYNP